MISKITLTRCLFGLLLGAFWALPETFAQSVATIGTGSVVPANTLYSPIYRFSSSSTTRANRSNVLFTQAELTAAGILPGTVITDLAFDKAGSGGTNANPLRLEIYMANSSTQPPLSTATTWASILGTHTQVYSNANTFIPAAPGWVTFTLNTPLTYTGGSLEIATESEITGSSPFATDKFDWKYTNGFSDYIVAGTATTTFLTTLSSTVAAYKHRPNTRFTFTPPSGVDGRLFRFPALTGAICPGNLALTVELNNAAADNLTAATINWKVNGVSQTPVSWTGLLTSGSSDTISLGSVPIVAGTLYSFEAFISSLTPAGDIDPLNDTLRVNGFQTGLSGVVTINPALSAGLTNFTSFNSLVTTLNAVGLCGPLTVNVATGTYPEQVTIDPITGASATNTLTINGNGATLTFLSTNTNDRATLKLDGADFVTVDSLVVVAEGELSTEFGFAVQLMNGADFNTFESCRFVSTQNSTSTAFACFVTSNSATSATAAGVAANNLTVRNCVTDGGYYGILINGSTTAPFAQNNLIEGNEVKNYRLYGIYLRGQQNTIVNRNLLRRPDRLEVSTTYPIYLVSKMAGVSVTNNRITDLAINTSSTSTAYGIYTTGVDGAAGQPLRIANNLMDGFENMNGANYGIYLASTDTVEVYHNTVFLDNTANPGSSVSRAFFISGTTTSVDLRNNIFSVVTGTSGAIHGIYISAAASTFSSNHNLIHVAGTNGTNHIGYLGADVTTFAAWQALNSNAYDQASVNADPLFNANLAPTNPAADNIGVLVPAAPIDFNGVTRGANPDPGALEFTPVLCPQPGQLTLVARSVASLTVDWVENGTATAWQLEYGVTGFVQGTGTLVLASGKPFAIGSLAANTAYDVYVRSVCSPGDTSGWSLKGTFSTSCGVFSLPFTENFEGPGWVTGTGALNTNSEIDNCWSRDPASGAVYLWGTRTGSTGTTTSGPDGDASTSGTGQYVFTEASNGTSGAQAWIATPQISLTGVTLPVLSFSYHRYGGDMGLMITQVNNGAGWVAVDTLSGEQQNGKGAAWARRQISLGTFAGDTVAIRWLGIRGAGFESDMALDSVAVEQASPCFPATALAVALASANVTCNGAADGAITIQVNSGTGPYSFAWSDGNTDSLRTGLAPGAYSVTVTDALGCAGTAAATLTQPYPLVLSTVTTDLTCADDNTGSIVLTRGVTADSTTVAYTGGNIPSDFDFFSLPGASACPAVLTVTIPVNAVITGVDVSYDFTAISNAWISEQYSWLNCVTTGIGEGALTLGPPLDTQGVATYRRTGLTIANGVIATNQLTFELHLGRDFGGSGCGTSFNFGSNWSITVHFETEGGTGTVTYLWSNGATNDTLTGLDGGLYTLVATDGAGCQDTLSVTVNEPQAVTAVATLIDGTCAGESNGAVSATVGGGTGTLAALWSNAATALSLTGLGVGDYSVVVTDSLGCTAADTVSVPEFALPVVDLGPDRGFCAGDGLTLDAGTGFVSYAWSNLAGTAQIAVNAAGSFSVMVTDTNGCEGIDTVQIAEFPLPVVDLGADTTLSDGDTLVLNAGNAAAYLWSTGATTQSISVTERTTYSVTVTSADGCTATDSIVVSVPTSLGSLFAGGNLLLYPNPASDAVYLSFELITPADVSLAMYDSQGKRVLSQSHNQLAGAQQLTLDLGRLAEGVYLLQVQVNARDVQTIRVVKK